MEKWSAAECRACLLDQKEHVAKRNRCIFLLRAIGGHEAVEALAAALEDPSVLLAHEVGFVLGQMRDPHAVPFLTAALENEALDPIVRHESAEALGAIGLPESLPVLERFSADPRVEVAETCQLAVGRIRWVMEGGERPEAAGGEAAAVSAYDTVDPAPAHAPGQKTVPELRDILVDEKLPLFERYRAMFTLRDINTDEAVLALAAGLEDQTSALFRHEIAYVMGQLQSTAAVPALVQTLNRKGEHAMGRHEAAEALGSIGDDVAVEELEKFRADPDHIVKQSCDVALDIAEFWNEGAEEEGEEPAEA